MNNFQEYPDADRDAKILLIDDEVRSIHSLRRILRRAGFSNLEWTTDPREAVQLCLWRRPDLVLLDLNMPFISGDQLLMRFREDLCLESHVPVIVLTGDGRKAAKKRAFLAGARDFISKPCSSQEVLLRVRNQLAISRVHRELHGQKSTLEEAVRERTAALEKTQLELLDRLARAAEYRDDDTGEHAKRVGMLAARIALELEMDIETVELIWRAAGLHDVGKIGIPDDILLKPGRLTSEEMGQMKTHVTIGADILAGGSSRYLQVAERIARTHHEWWDGNGYLGLRDEQIPIEGRIVAVADVFDALTHERPYKSAWTSEAAVEHVNRLSGSQFDPAVVEAFGRVLKALENEGQEITGTPDRCFMMSHN